MPSSISRTASAVRVRTPSLRMAESRWRATDRNNCPAMSRFVPRPPRARPPRAHAATTGRHLARRIRRPKPRPSARPWLRARVESSARGLTADAGRVASAGPAARAGLSAGASRIASASRIADAGRASSGSAVSGPPGQVIELPRPAAPPPAAAWPARQRAPKPGIRSPRYHG